jgi:ATP-dependent DNA ligase
MNLIAESYLTCTEGGSNKQYLARLVERDGAFEVPCLYGAIGAKAASTTKYQGADRAKAQAAFSKVVAEKRAKGYREGSVPAELALAGVSAPTPAAALAPKEDATGVPRFGAQLAGEQGLTPLETAIAAPQHFLVEEKYDGFRALVAFTPDRGIAIRNRHGEDKGRLANAPHLEAALRALADATPALYDGTVIDGELVGASWSETAHLLGGAGRTETRLRFVAFDLPYAKGVDLRELPLRERRLGLDLLLAGTAHPLELAPALTPEPGLLERIWARGGEGLIVKQLSAPYLAGNRNAWAKLKRIATADGVIVGIEPGKGKYAGMTGALVLGQYRDGALIEITRVSGMTDAERANLGEADLGRVVEFAFQERTADSYRHPRFVRLRDDKEPTDCRWGD